MVGIKLWVDRYKFYYSQLRKKKKTKDAGRQVLNLKSSILKRYHLSLSGDLYALRFKKDENRVGAKKNYDDPVPTELSIYQLNVRIISPFSFKQWNTHVLILQETFLLGRWKRNLMRRFYSWLKMRMNKSSSSNLSRDLSKKVLVVESSFEIWSQNRHELKKHKSGMFYMRGFKVDLPGARH